VVLIPILLDNRVYFAIQVVNLHAFLSLNWYYQHLISPVGRNTLGDEAYFW